ncbi:auxin response factor 4 isoform X2 [Beta vulgaris subsp. vulgaris]|uniref:auxin response factor 4 isoform X2 n=1 Tax=Beta vulgaris subsp. vulgaris TaxID=3555 RepID=UPI002037180B|nr:auxin response factor 4 isoform X2 [Beta vulgaris subsp. vulgaris]
MEIDLNHEVSEVEKIAYCYGDCEKGIYGCCVSSSSSSCSSNSSPSAVTSYMELWHACAGPLISLPRRGNVVVYFPQGHLEQVVASSSPYSPVDLPTYDLPPQIFCRVANIQLLANKENDEVYTQLTLFPLPEFGRISLGSKEVEGLGGEEDAAEVLPKSTPHMFCKTLTASDTSTHGGFSVPRRAAEDCFPPLDYKLQRPSQELVAKDLHGVEWKFRHIYRGQPRRHLLTTGWSVFVSQKNLVSGDAVLFLRGEDGELRLGLRRAIRPKSGVPDSVIGKQSMYPNVLSAVVNAVSTKTMFHVFYSPRASHPEFIVPHQRYVKSFSNPISAGTRFRTRIEVDESPERRCRGIVVGVNDIDPYKWPNSKWRCLLVRWDEDIVSDKEERVSPWEIDPSVSLPPLSIQSSPRIKKLRTAGGLGNLDFEESVRSSKVLQGQENVSFISPPYGCDKVHSMLDNEPGAAGQQSLSSTRLPPINVSEFRSLAQPMTYTGILESNRFPKVLQGQEICPLRSLTGKMNFNPSAWIKPSLATSYFNLYQGPKTSFYPLASEGVRNMYFPFDIYKSDQDSVMVPCKNTMAKENSVFNLSSFHSNGFRKKDQNPNIENEDRPAENMYVHNSLNTSRNDQKDAPGNGPRPHSKLFGFPLERETSSTNSEICSRRSCTKVHKQGSLVGRAIDLSKLKSYADLMNELEHLFGMEGLLQDPAKGWRILYTDKENDMMVVGDDPWNEFCDVVSKIHIYTREEVEKMTAGMVTDDNQSCLEEAPSMLDASKSSSVGQPDSSPTETKN